MGGRSKARALALALSCALLLGGCSAMLNRPYSVVSPHAEHPATGEDASTIQAESYPELVNAVLYFVSQSVEDGVVHLVNYDGDVEEDLNRACLEVAKDDPLGAYAVDFIKNDYTRVLATYEASLHITYRRTQEQMRALVNVTGSSAIREELRDALAAFQPELALRVGYFAEDEAYIAALARQAYYDTPAAALGMPEFSAALYPDHGTQRIVEITLTYPEAPEALRRKSEELIATAETLVTHVRAQQQTREGRLTQLYALLPDAVRRAPGGGGPTAWDALVGEGADSEGMALAFELLCDLLDIECSVVEGTLDGQPHFWNLLSGTEYQHVDLTREEYGRSYTDQGMVSMGYAWEGSDSIQSSDAPDGAQ